MRQGVKARFGAIGKDVADGLSLRHDHGTQYMAHDFRNEIRWLGITSSPAFVRTPQGNGCAERFIRTLKKNLLWVRTFETVEYLRQALLEFQRRYNEEWLIERHGHQSPAQFRRDLEAAVQLPHSATRCLKNRRRYKPDGRPAKPGSDDQESLGRSVILNNLAATGAPVITRKIRVR